jgi:hypothetical protein
METPAPHGRFLFVRVCGLVSPGRDAYHRAGSVSQSLDLTPELPSNARGFLQPSQQ